MQIQMRNKQTGEFRDVEADGSEFRSLQKEVLQSGAPAWEQTSYAHADAVKDRAAFGELDESDLGEDHQADLKFAAVKLNDEGVSPEANPHLQLTPGEIEAGLTPESKLDELREMYSGSGAEGRQAVIEAASDTIADQRRERTPAQQAQGLRARAGGSDDRSAPPTNPEAASGSQESQAAAPKAAKPAAESGS